MQWSFLFLTTSVVSFKEIADDELGGQVGRISDEENEIEEEVHTQYNRVRSWSRGCWWCCSRRCRKYQRRGRTGTEAEYEVKFEDIEDEIELDFKTINN